MWLGRRHRRCVVIPVINEGVRIGRLLDRMAALDIASIADILIVDGGSTDGSLDTEKLSRRGVRGLLVKTGPGKLSAQLRCAYAFALDQGYEGIVTIDGNDKDDPEAIPRFIAALDQGVDFVQASRFIEGGMAEGTPRSRDIAIRWIHAPLLRLASGFPWTDTTQGFRAYSRRLLLDPRVQPFRDVFATYELLAYMSYRAPRLGYRCLELPTVRRYPPGDVPTKIGGIRGNLVVLAILFKAALGLLNPPESADATAAIAAQPRRSAIATLAISVASAVMGAGVAALVLLLEPDQRYPDFIVGRMTIEGGTKLRDLLIGPAFVAVTLATFWFLSRVMARLEARAGPGHAGEFAGQLIWWSIPAVAAGGGLILGTFIDMRLLVITAVGVGAVTLACALTANRKEPLPPALVGMTLLAGVLIALFPTELALVLSRLGAGRASETTDLARATIILIPVVLAAACLALILLPLQVVRWLPGLLALGQIGLLAFFLVLFPSRFASVDGQIVRYPTTVWLTVLVAGAVTVGALDVVRRLWNARNPGTAAFLSPLAIFALAAGIRAGTTVAPHVPHDDYHFGELLLGWSSYGPKTLPYVDYMPAHGLVPDGLPGLVSNLFYDGTAATIGESIRIALIMLALAAFLALWLLTGSVGLAFVSTLFISGQLNWIFLVPFMCLWFSPALRREPSRWLCVWGLTAPLLILGVPAHGLLLIAASGVIAARAAWDLWKYPAGCRWKEVAASILVLASALVFTPLMPMLLGAIGYVVENGAINQIAYGTPWGLGWQTGLPAGLVTESIRMSWLAIPVAGVSAIYVAAKRRMTGVVLPALVVVLFSLLIVPYTMGRIDSGGGSRPELTAIFGWTVLIPIVAWQVLKPPHRAPFLLLVGAMAGALNFTALTFNTLHLSAASILPAGLLRDGSAVGLPRLGHGVVEEQHWDRLIRLRNLLSRSLKPDETYLDLTNRTSHYFYLDRKPPIPVPAPNNLVSLHQQRRAVQALAADPPPLALLEALNIVHDGVASSLRSPLLYRFVLDHYTPGWEDGFIVGRLAEIGEGAAHQVQVPVKSLDGAERKHEVSRLEPAIPVDEAFPIDALSVGNRVIVGDGVDRRIIRIDAGSRAVFVDGARLDADLLGSLNHFDVSVGPGEETHRLRMALLEKAFAPTDLARLPVTWGRSNRTLAGRMEPVRDLVPRDSGEAVSAEAGVKEFSYDLSGQALGGREADLLHFIMECHGRSQDPRVVVTWNGQSNEGLRTGGQLRFTGDEGPLIVPLYAYPRWVTLDRVTGVSIALETPEACSSLGVVGAGLSRAEMFRRSE